MRKVALTLLLQIQTVLSKVQVFPADSYEDCSDGGKAKYIDFSGLEYEYVNDTEYALTGKFNKFNNFCHVKLKQNS